MPYAYTSVWWHLSKQGAEHVAGNACHSSTHHGFSRAEGTPRMSWVDSSNVVVLVAEAFE
jgi:hypothetical protein